MGLPLAASSTYSIPFLLGCTADRDDRITELESDDHHRADSVVVPGIEGTVW
jgi:hypothetical protein